MVVIFLVAYVTEVPLNSKLLLDKKYLGIETAGNNLNGAENQAKDSGALGH